MGTPSRQRHRNLVPPTGGITTTSETSSHRPSTCDGGQLRAGKRPVDAPEQICSTLGWKSHPDETLAVARSIYLRLPEGFGITHRVSDFDRSQLYLLLLPVVMSGNVELLDDPKLMKELRSLERRRGPSGRNRVEPSPRRAR
jgi:hypothetical protein